MVGLLKPIGHDTQLIYQCPKCKFKHFKLVSEVTRPNAALHCHCGVISEIHQLERPRFVAKFVKQKEGVLSERDKRTAARCVEAYFPDNPTEAAVRIARGLARNPSTWQELCAFAMEG